MDALHNLVTSGKVLYLGISDTPAWIVAAANTYARAHGKTPFVIYQGLWSVARRDFERDIIPVCRHFGLALAPWGAVGGGRFQTKAQLEAKKKAGEKVRAVMGPPELTPDEVNISAALEKVAGEVGGGVSITAVALAYVMQKTPNVFPIVGGRKVEHLKDNMKALSIHLSDEQIAELEKVVPFEVGFPAMMIGDDPKTTGQGPMVALSGKMSWVNNPKPIGHL